MNASTISEIQPLNENRPHNASDAFISSENISNGTTFMNECPICGTPFKRVRPWQEGCGSADCRRRKSQIKIYSSIAREVTRRFADEIVVDCKMIVESSLISGKISFIASPQEKMELLPIL